MMCYVDIHYDHCYASKSNCYDFKANCYDFSITRKAHYIPKSKLLVEVY